MTEIIKSLDPERIVSLEEAMKKVDAYKPPKEEKRRKPPKEEVQEGETVEEQEKQGDSADSDYLDLYRKDAQSFIKYFKNRPLEEKRIILNDILDCDFSNEKVIMWLDQKYQGLIISVGKYGP